MVGLAAVPPVRVGLNRCEALVFDPADGKVVGEKQLELLFLQPPPDLRVTSAERIADFSHLGVGPWLRDQIFMHVDMLNERAQWNLSASTGLPCWMEPAEAAEPEQDAGRARGDAEAPDAYWGQRGGIFGGSLPCETGADAPAEADSSGMLNRQRCMDVD